MYDVVIAGAGPAGLRLAKLLDSGLDVLVLESKARVGAKACSGLMSKNLEGFMPIDSRWVEHRVSGALAHFPQRDVELRKPGIAAYVVDRTGFDRALAEDAGRPIRFGTRLLGLDVRDDRVKLKTSKGFLESRILVGCDGAHSLVRRHFREEPRELLNGVIAYTGEKNSSESVGLWFDRRLLPDGFFWKIPRGSRTEYGVWGRGASVRGLRSFFKLGRCDCAAAAIPLGMVRTAFDRTILLGDAACQVKPWSGGGIIWSFTAADIAAGKIREALENRDMGLLDGYDRDWKKRMGGPLRKGMLMRKLYRNLPGGMIGAGLGLYTRWGKPNNLDMDFL